MTEKTAAAKATETHPAPGYTPCQQPGDLGIPDSPVTAVVGIGASAGGLEAMQSLLPGLPAGLGLAYVVVQHLAPKHHSMLDELLARHTSLAIEKVLDGTAIKPDTIFITPLTRISA